MYVCECVFKSRDNGNELDLIVNKISRGRRDIEGEKRWHDGDKGSSVQG